MEYFAAGQRDSDTLEQAIADKTPFCAVCCFLGQRTLASRISLEMRAYVEKWASGDARMIPVILPDVKEAPELPLFVRQTLVGGHA